MASNRPPGFTEIFLVPIIGIGLIELLHTRQNELYLLFMPLITVMFRMFMAQFKQPSPPAGADLQRFEKYKRSSLAVEQLAAFVLLFVQGVALLAGAPGIPKSMWFFVLAFLAVYVGLRMVARHRWILAAESKL